MEFQANQITAGNFTLKISLQPNINNVKYIETKRKFKKNNNNGSL